MDLRGKTVREVEAGARIRVWYEEEQDGGGKARVAYLGTTSAYSAAEGLRVLFDGYDESEQEVVDAADEWEWAPNNSTQKISNHLGNRIVCQKSKAKIGPTKTALN